MLQSVEGMVLLPGYGGVRRDGEVMFATAGDKGLIRIWSTCESTPLHCLEPLEGSEKEEEEGKREEEEEGRQVYVGLHYCCREGVMVGVTSDHNIIVYGTTDGYSQIKQVILN